jgi:hypothetical protein
MSLIYFLPLSELNGIRTPSLPIADYMIDQVLPDGTVTVTPLLIVTGPAVSAL